MKQYPTKFLLAFLVMLFVVSNLSAQTMSVASFEAVTNDMSAMQQGTKALDANGDPCAIIKIQTKETGFTFDVGSLGIVKTVNKVGEIWVYVPFGVKRISLNHPTYQPITYNIPVSVEKGRVYKMILNVKKLANSNTLTLKYSPANAIVLIDGNMVPGKNGVVEKELSIGKHEYSVIAEGYNQIDGLAKISADEPAKIVIQLVANTPNAPLSPNVNTDNVSTPVSSQDFGSHEYVDLGLPSGTLWATCNVGASKPEEYGDYFAWGETTGYNSGKTYFEWSSYKHCNGSKKTMTKYCTNAKYGKVDNKTVLDPEDDAATANWGEGWKMPTVEQLEELKNKKYVTTEWTTLNGVKGRKITSKKNGKSIFLPAASCRSGTSLGGAGSVGLYWSSSLRSSGSSSARRLFFYSGGIYTDYYYRYYGFSVRPVRQ